MNWVKKLLARFRRAPRLVVKFRHDTGSECVRFRVSVLGTERAHEYEKRMMAVFLLAMERGTDELFKKSGCKSKGMLDLSLHARLLRAVLTGETEAWR